MATIHHAVINEDMHSCSGILLGIGLSLILWAVIIIGIIALVTR